MIRGAVERAPAHCAVVSSAVVFEKLFAKANSCVSWLQAVVLRSGAGGSPVPFSVSVAQRGVHATLVTLSFLAPPSAPIVADLPPLPLSWQIPDNAHNQDVGACAVDVHDRLRGRGHATAAVTRRGGGRWQHWRSTQLPVCRGQPMRPPVHESHPPPLPPIPSDRPPAPAVGGSRQPPPSPASNGHRHRLNAGKSASSPGDTPKGTDGTAGRNRG